MSSIDQVREPDSEQIVVGILEEPELIVAGVRAMLALPGSRARLAPDGELAEVDVVLCDPLEHAGEVEDYLTRVTEQTSAPVIAFSWSSGPRGVRRAMAAGARAHVSKRATAGELGATIEAVHRGETLVPDVSDPTDALSAREADVLALICRGLSNDEIAAALFVSVNSVKTYIRQIYSKIAVNRRSQAVAWGIARGY